jgi:hypothetical protein
MQMATVDEVFVLLVKNCVSEDLFCNANKISIVFCTEFCFMSLILTHTNPGRKADGVQHWVSTENIWAKQGRRNRVL